jgi:hypothetical protein
MVKEKTYNLWSGAPLESIFIYLKQYVIFIRVSWHMNCCISWAGQRRMVLGPCFSRGFIASGIARNDAPVFRYGAQTGANWPFTTCGG